jgi:rRNA maturation RNase YbeY
MSTINSSIRFHYLTDPFYFPRRTAIKNLLHFIFKDHSTEIKAINYVFCSDKYLLTLNRDFLKHNYYTDIITFELNEPGEAILSDVYISLDRARDNAKLFHVSLNVELLRLLIHGSLHLCGFRDKSKKDTAQMREVENFYINRLFHVKQRDKV